MVEDGSRGKRKDLRSPHKEEEALSPLWGGLWVGGGGGTRGKNCPSGERDLILLLVGNGISTPTTQGGGTSLPLIQKPLLLLVLGRSGKRGYSPCPTTTYRRSGQML